MKKVFVIIVTYKGKHWYDKCFASLRESTLPVQTVVIDNTPGEEDAEYIKTHYPEMHLIKPEENLGFGKANNLGMRYALDNGCDYVFLLNQDTWIEKDSIAKLVEVADRHTEYGIVSPMHMNAEMNQINMMYYDGHNNCDLVSDFYCGTLKEIYPMRYVNAAAWLLPRKTLETIGGFCPLIHMYGEDDDYLNRAVYHYIGVCICPSSRIVHDTREFLSEQRACQVTASMEHLNEHLDINKPFLYRHLASAYIRRYLRYIFRFEYKKAQYIKKEYSLLRHNRKAIIECRKEHVVRKSNWL